MGASSTPFIPGYFYRIMKLVMEKLWRAAWPMGAVFLFDAVINNPLGLYDRFPNYDIPMHILGGIVTTWCLVRFLKIQKIYTALKPRWLRYWFLIANTAFIGVVWEFYEWIFDQLFPWLSVQTGLADTLGDLLNDLIGATILIGLVWWKSQKKTRTQPIQEAHNTRFKPAKSLYTKKSA